MGAKSIFCSSGNIVAPLVVGQPSRGDGLGGKECRCERSGGKGVTFQTRLVRRASRKANKESQSSRNWGQHKGTSVPSPFIATNLLSARALSGQTHRKTRSLRRATLIRATNAARLGRKRPKAQPKYRLGPAVSRPWLSVVSCQPLVIFRCSMPDLKIFPSRARGSTGSPSAKLSGTLRSE